MKRMDCRVELGRDEEDILRVRTVQRIPTALHRMAGVGERQDRDFFPYLNEKDELLEIRFGWLQIEEEIFHHPQLGPVLYPLAQLQLLLRPLELGSSLLSPCPSPPHSLEVW